MAGGVHKRIKFGTLEGAVRRGRGRKEKEWTECVQSCIRAFGIAGDWKATALESKVWIDTVTDGRRRFMTAWRKEEVDAARHRQRKRVATRLEIVFVRGSVDYGAATPISLVNGPKESCVKARDEPRPA